MSKEIEIVVEIPKTDLQPLNGRIIVVTADAEDVKTKGGIHIPTNFTEQKGEDVKHWEFKRYFVVAVAYDVNLLIDDGKEVRKLKRGDEVQPFFHKDALNVDYPQVVDWDNGGTKYITLHESEVAVVNGKIPEMDKKD